MINGDCLNFIMEITIPLKTRYSPLPYLRHWLCSSPLSYTMATMCCSPVKCICESCGALYIVDGALTDKTSSIGYITVLGRTLMLVCSVNTLRPKTKLPIRFLNAFSWIIITLFRLIILLNFVKLISHRPTKLSSRSLLPCGVTGPPQWVKKVKVNAQYWPHFRCFAYRCCVSLSVTAYDPIT